VDASGDTPTKSVVPQHPPASPGLVDEGRFPPGTLLAQRYRIVNLLGRGGMGEVYRANDLLLGQTVALKFLPPAASEEALNAFRNEVRTARQVSHPNVCRVYDIGEAEGLTYLTMEYVDGEDLRSLLRRIGKLPHDKALEVARKTCAGLAAAHDKGVIHRDLKPSNIMLDGEGQVRIADFGLAGFAGQLRDVLSGTPAYMAPEQKAGKEATARSDIYALGLVLHEVFTGKRPSKDSKPELDPLVERVIHQCLDPDPQRRPATALDVSAAMAATAAGRPRGDRAPSKILIVEDEPGIAFSLENDLRMEGYEVAVAGDGVEAVRRARAEAFDLILLDVMLPNKDGFEVCRELRRGGLDTPIIMLTARTQEAEKILGLNLGADDYLTKPFSPRELRARIRAVFRRAVSPGERGRGQTSI